MGSLARVVTVNNRVALLVNSCVVVVLPAPTSRDEEARGPITSRVNDHAADVLAVPQVLITLVDVFELVLSGDQLVEFELAGIVESEQAHDVVLRIG